MCGWVDVNVGKCVSECVCVCVCVWYVRVDGLVCVGE